MDAAALEPQRGSFPEATFTEAAFLWAVAAVRSRVHSPLEGDQLALVPLADLVHPRIRTSSKPYLRWIEPSSRVCAASERITMLLTQRCPCIIALCVLSCCGIGKECRHELNGSIRPRILRITCFNFFRSAKVCVLFTKHRC